jgi:hypothetical protein
MDPGPDDRLWREARARMSWGETTEELRRFLVSRGLPPFEVQEWLVALRRQRAAEVRAIGRNRLLIGLASSSLFVLFWSPETFSTKLGAGLLACGVVGLYALTDGALKILFPGMWKGCLRAMDTPPD